MAASEKYTFKKSQCEQLAKFFEEYADFVTEKGTKAEVNSLKRTFTNAKPSAGWEKTGWVSLEFFKPDKIELVDFAIELLWKGGD